MADRKTLERFIVDARMIHGDKYDYSRTIYINCMSKVIAICQEHGEFSQTPNKHLLGRGCPGCGLIKARFKQKTTDEFVADAIRVHGSQYDYRSVEYNNDYTKVSVMCPRHGKFRIRPADHIRNKQGCGICAKSNRSRVSQRWLDSLNVPNHEREIIILAGGKPFKVDAYCVETNTVYEFWGDYWHGNPKEFPPHGINKNNKKTFGELYNETQEKRLALMSVGYNLVEIWESEFKDNINQR